MSLSQRKQMVDAAGKPVFEMRHKHLTMHNTITVSRPGSDTPCIEAKQVHDHTCLSSYKFPLPVQATP